MTAALDHTFPPSPARGRQVRRKRYAFAAVAMALFVFFCLGFLVFVARLNALYVPDGAARMDAIVVLTGGKYRVAQSLELLRERQGKRLLISGVHPDTSMQSLISLVPEQADLLRCCVDLGREATSTVGNAWEAKRWVERGGYRRILLVTSNYHMPRSLMELRRAMPGVSLTPYPVFHEDIIVSDWWRDVGTAELLLKEYIKFIASAARAHLYPRVEGMQAATITPLRPAG